MALATATAPVLLTLSDGDRLLTREEVCGMLRCSKSTLHRTVRSGKLPVSHPNSHPRFRLSDVLRLLDDQKQKPKKKPPRRLAGKAKARRK